MLPRPETTDKSLSSGDQFGEWVSRDPREDPSIDLSVSWRERGGEKGGVEGRGEEPLCA